ncbi:hypothetical protein [Chryseobacterium vrystaatense]|uniref:hypothetical protein n=1 Tax=Chryseobacterium vrystaatense TaxID=307480 RepID=UPI0015872D8E|nr:hypothetical protein [Chryseobacterium vrystaatense]
MITVPTEGYQVKFVSAIAGNHFTSGTPTAKVIAKEAGSSGTGSVSNINVQKI